MGVSKTRQGLGLPIPGVSALVPARIHCAVSRAAGFFVAAAVRCRWTWRDSCALERYAPIPAQFASASCERRALPALADASLRHSGQGQAAATRVGNRRILGGIRAARHKKRAARIPNLRRAACMTVGSHAQRPTERARERPTAPQHPQPGFVEYGSPGIDEEDSVESKDV